MKLTEIKALIDKAIGKRGLIRTPAWWVRKIFYELIEWVTSSLTQNNREILLDVDKSLEKSLPYISVYFSSSSGGITVEGKKYTLGHPGWIKIPYKKTFKWEGNTHSSVDFRGASLCPQDLSGLFQNFYSFGFLDLSPLNTSEVTDMRSMFQNFSGKQIKFGNKFNLENVEDMSRMFMGSRFTYINLSNRSRGVLKNASEMYQNCVDTQIIFDEFYSSTDNYVNYKALFKGCTKLQYINPNYSYSWYTRIPNIYSVVSFYHVSSLQEAFSGCSSLKLMNISVTALSQGTSLESMFEGCSGLTQLTIRVNTSTASSLKNMFKGCSAIEYLYLSQDFFKMVPEEDTEIDFSDMTKWVDSSVKSSLVTNLYTRTSSDLTKGKITIKLSQETYNVLTEDQLTTIKNKGYSITSTTTQS